MPIDQDIVDENIFNEVVTASDRAMAIASTAFVEHYLEAVIADNLPNMSKTVHRKLFGGPLGNLSAKTEIARAMDLIGPVTTSDLRLIRRIRNEFAHNLLPLTFESTEISKFVNKLKLADRFENYREREPMIDTPLEPWEDISVERLKFECATTEIGLTLQGRIMGFATESP